jgi:hypothetical protein
MLEKEVNHFLLLLHHLFQIDLGWCSQFIIIVRGLITFWSVVVMLALAVRNGVLVVFGDVASAIGLLLDFRLP